MTLGNFLPLRRELRDHWTYKDSQYLHLWLEMLYCARFSKEPKTDVFKGTLYTLNYGEFLFSRPSYSTRLNIPEARVRKAVNLLIKDEMIEVVGSLGKNKPTIYKIINYETYNNSPSESQAEQGFSDISTKSQPSDNQVTTKSQPLNKKLKTVKNEKTNIYTDEFETFYSLYPNPSDKKRSFTNWNKAIKQHGVEAIMQSVKNYKKVVEKEKRDKQYIKTSANYLGKEEPYLDYLEGTSKETKPIEPFKPNFVDMTKEIMGED